ncbi:MAG: lactate utilization protein [Candidatus Bathyarchaeota archaeon]|nr:lactate utilization protein [Candidatus Bathyarchaeota archaeon]
MRKVKKWYANQKVRRTLAALERNGFQTFFVSTRAEALDKVLSLIPTHANVGIGGSVTLREIDLIDALASRGNTVLQHWSQPEENLRAIMIKQLNSDVFLASSNAVTEDGRLVNIDKAGNRVVAMIFGPRKVILVIGVNKIVKDLEEGILRARNVAAPMNARRRGDKTPCATTGVCTDCETPDRLCRVITIMEKKPSRTDVAVILVGEELGF